MPLPGMRRDGRVKPEWGTPLDTGHPLCEEIAGVWAMLEGTPILVSGGAVGVLADALDRTPGVIPAFTGLQPVPGYTGSAMQFPHLNQAFVNLPLTEAVNHASSFTIMSRFMWTGGTPSYNPVMSRWNQAGNIGYGLSIDPSFHMRGDSQNVSGGGFTGSVAVSANVWHDVAFTVDGAGPRGIYVDGLPDTLSGTGAVLPGTGGTTVVAAIGQDGSFAASANTPEIRGWQGLIEYVYLWHRALRAQEIADLHFSPYGIFAPTTLQKFYSIAAGAFSNMVSIARGVARATAAILATGTTLGMSASVARAYAAPPTGAGAISARSAGVSRDLGALIGSGSIFGRSASVARAYAASPVSGSFVSGTSIGVSRDFGALVGSGSILGTSASVARAYAAPPTGAGAISAFSISVGKARAVAPTDYVVVVTGPPNPASFGAASAEASYGAAPRRASYSESKKP